VLHANVVFIDEENPPRGIAVLYTSGAPPTDVKAVDLLTNNYLERDVVIEGFPASNKIRTPVPSRIVAWQGPYMVLSLPVSEGMSGGPVYVFRQLAGIVVMSDDVSYAVPSEMIRRTLDSVYSASRPAEQRRKLLSRLDTFEKQSRDKLGQKRWERLRAATLSEILAAKPQDFAEIRQALESAGLAGILSKMLDPPFWMLRLHDLADLADLESTGSGCDGLKPAPLEGRPYESYLAYLKTCYGKQSFGSLFDERVRDGGLLVNPKFSSTLAEMERIGIIDVSGELARKRVSEAVDTLRPAFQEMDRKYGALQKLDQKTASFSLTVSCDAELIADLRGLITDCESAHLFIKRYEEYSLATFLELMKRAVAEDEAELKRLR
jgi:hypothetical protein